MLCGASSLWPPRLGIRAIIKVNTKKITLTDVKLSWYYSIPVDTQNWLNRSTRNRYNSRNLARWVEHWWKRNVHRIREIIVSNLLNYWGYYWSHNPHWRVIVSRNIWNSDQFRYRPIGCKCDCRDVLCHWFIEFNHGRKEFLSQINPTIIPIL